MLLLIYINKLIIFKDIKIIIINMYTQIFNFIWKVIQSFTASFVRILNLSIIVAVFKLVLTYED